jgi:uncharacterized protein (DUF697 family)
MPTQQQSERARKTIMVKIWDEVKKINWQEINRQTHKNFQIGLVGSKQQISEMKKWLKSFDYPLAIEYGSKLKNDLKIIQDRIDDHTISFQISDGKIDERLIRTTAFCIVEKNYLNEIRRLNIETYTYDKNKDSIPNKVHANHPELSFALSFNLPVFRVEHSNIEINSTAIQNTSWAIGTASPNIIPGPHQSFTAPIEAVADFTVLTANETKLLFELVGLSGYDVNPLNCLIEFGVTLGLAKMAETVATNMAGKLPAGAGLVAKGAIAYAFTWAIGEAIFFYISTGQKAGKKFFEDRIKFYFEKGKKIASDEEKKSKNKK